MISFVVVLPTLPVMATASAGICTRQACAAAWSPARLSGTMNIHGPASPLTVPSGVTKRAWGYSSRACGSASAARAPRVKASPR